MPRRRTVPSYRLHKQSGQAIVTLTDGNGSRRDVPLGKHGTAESRVEYLRILGEWEAADRQLPSCTQHAGPDITLNELMERYWRFAENYYVKDGQSTSEQECIRQALRPVKRLYGHTLAKDFGPLALKAVRQEMVKHRIVRKIKVTDPKTGIARKEEKLLALGLARKNINKQIGRIRRLFAWAVEEELLPVEVHAALLRVKGLRKDKGQAREKPRVRPVEPAVVDATLPFLPGMVRAMVGVQRLCGGRPQDIVEMRLIDIDMSNKVWEFRPRRYKTEHHNQDDLPEGERVVFLGPRAQAIIKPLLPLNVEAYLFSPSRSEEERNKQRRGARKTPQWPSHLRRQEQKRSRNPTRPPRDRYDVAAYRRAIRRACEKAGVPIWHPNQLRHLRGTEIRRNYGLEASQAVLGHAELSVTQVYAEIDWEAARTIMGEVG
jgi:integrase